MYPTLQHPVPTHPAYIPEPPSTPASPQGYQRFTSSPGPPIPNVLPQPPYPHPVQQYTSPFQHQHHQPPLQPPQQASVPNFAAWGMNDATAQFGMQLGQTAVAAGQDYVQKNVRLCYTFPLSYSNQEITISLVLLYRSHYSSITSMSLIRTSSGRFAWCSFRGCINRGLARPNAPNKVKQSGNPRVKT
jgi:hypothetical protein